MYSKPFGFLILAEVLLITWSPIFKVQIDFSIPRIAVLVLRHVKYFLHLCLEAFSVWGIQSLMIVVKNRKPALENSRCFSSHICA